MNDYIREAKVTEATLEVDREMFRQVIKISSELDLEENKDMIDEHLIATMTSYLLRFKQMHTIAVPASPWQALKNRIYAWIGRNVSFSLGVFLDLKLPVKTESYSAMHFLPELTRMYAPQFTRGAFSVWTKDEEVKI